MKREKAWRGLPSFPSSPWKLLIATSFFLINGEIRIHVADFAALAQRRCGVDSHFQISLFFSSFPSSTSEPTALIFPLDVAVRRNSRQDSNIKI